MLFSVLPIQTGQVSARSATSKGFFPKKMNDELFDPKAVTALSPKIQWLARHSLETINLEDLGGIDPCTRDMVPKWVCRPTKPVMGRWMANEVGGGETEVDACAEWALKNGARLWFEEQQQDNTKEAA